MVTDTSHVSASLNEHKLNEQSVTQLLNKNTVMEFSLSPWKLNKVKHNDSRVTN